MPSAWFLVCSFPWLDRMTPNIWFIIRLLDGDHERLSVSKGSDMTAVTASYGTISLSSIWINIFPLGNRCRQHRRYMALAGMMSTTFTRWLPLVLMIHWTQLSNPLMFSISSMMINSWRHLEAVSPLSHILKRRKRSKAFSKGIIRGKRSSVDGLGTIHRTALIYR